MLQIEIRSPDLEKEVNALVNTFANYEVLS